MSDDPVAVLDELERSVYRLRPSRGQGFQRADTLGRVTLSERSAILPTGFPTIDVYIEGLGAGRFITLAARPGVGKTTLALNIGANVAKAGFKVAVYSLEMSAPSLIEKVVLNESNVDGNRVRDMRLFPEDIDRIGQTLVRMASWQLWFDDTSSLTLSELRTRTKRMKTERGLDLLIVDYLQLLTPPKAENRVNEVAAITRELKALALELSIPILAMSQMNRSVEQGENGEPFIWQLRDSGTVEQDSDQVILLWRDPKDPRNGPGAEVRYTHGKVGKNRWGREGPFELALIGAQSKFVGV
jgi:replicative DNA helicase